MWTFRGETGKQGPDVGASDLTDDALRLRVFSTRLLANALVGWLVATVAYERIRVLFTGYVALRFELDALGVNVTGVIRTMTAEHNTGELMGHG